MATVRTTTVGWQHPGEGFPGPVHTARLWAGFYRCLKASLLPPYWEMAAVRSGAVLRERPPRCFRPDEAVGSAACGLLLADSARTPRCGGVCVLTPVAGTS
ncbi:hypothetical protein TREES_T100021435 [Tupaia chinensis]|uniref:Uncharacterized protein n=1 Tax=Tupaia chinensis TaxID=246437 RepID=L9L203_TUPCH|nr:hypothetical protein TREES_T100021435 [Tupaia chinensis]